MIPPFMIPCCPPEPTLDAIIAAVGNVSISVPRSAALSVLDPDMIEIVTWNTYSLGVSGLGDLSDADEIWFTVKNDLEDVDEVALIQISLTEGLLFAAGEAADDASLGEIDFVGDAADGVISRFIDASITGLLTPTDGRNDLREWDLKKLVGTTLTQMTFGQCVVRRGVTRAIT